MIMVLTLVQVVNNSNSHTNKVEEEESLAQAYGEMAEDTQSVDDEIDKAIGGTSAGDDSLAKLKAKMGM